MICMTSSAFFWNYPVNPILTKYLKIYQEELAEEFVELAEDMMKIERWGDNTNVYKIAFEIVQLGKNGEKHKFYALYNKLHKTKKTSKLIKDKFDEMSEIILHMD